MLSFRQGAAGISNWFDTFVCFLWQNTTNTITWGMNPFEKCWCMRTGEVVRQVLSFSNAFKQSDVHTNLAFLRSNWLKAGRFSQNYIENACSTTKGLKMTWLHRYWSLFLSSSRDAIRQRKFHVPDKISSVIELTLLHTKLQIGFRYSCENFGYMRHMFFKVRAEH